MIPVRNMRTSLRQGLDKEVYQVVRKFIDQNNGRSDVRYFQVYDWIRKSNSSLKRRPKPLLEDSIERVLAVIKEEEEQANSDGSEEEIPNVDAKAATDIADIMNQGLRKSIANSAGTQSPKPTTNGESSQTLQKRRERGDGEPKSKKQKRAAQEVEMSSATHLRLEDLGGVDPVLQQFEDHLTLPLLRPDDYLRQHLTIPRGVLLHGPPGCGKTAVSKAFAAELGIPFIEILGPSVVSGMSGESEKQIREIFERARREAPCLIFIDEIDAITPKRESSQSQMEKRIVSQLLVSMDSLALEGNDGRPVIVLAATNRPDSIDPALRRGGRFDTEINMGVPNEGMRESILKAQTRETPTSADVDFCQLARLTAGFVGADLRDLVGKAGTWSMYRFKEALKKQAEDDEKTEMQVDSSNTTETSGTTEMIRSIRRLIKRAKDRTREDPPGFETALKMEAFLAVLPSIQPSSKREGFATVPDTTWADIGALEAVREELQMSVVEPIKNPQRFKNVGISAPSGVLLWGPPGCGKTLLAKAVANESKANFISVKGPELLNKYVGESERAVRQVFTRARSSIPCVIFFDEFDALVPRRNDSLSEASARVVNSLLTELDGLSVREGIYIVAATNRPDMIDAAILRPGRLEKLLFVGLPGPAERVEILRALIRKTPIQPQLAEVARRSECDRFSGADMGSLLRQAGLAALSRQSDTVTEMDFETAMTSIRPSVSDLARYERLRRELDVGGLS